MATYLSSKKQIPFILTALVLACSCRSREGSSTIANSTVQPNRTEMQKALVVNDLADPDVLKVNDNLFFLSGTGANPKADLPIYESLDLEKFTFKRNYTPSGVDKAFDYCDLWAPDLSLKDGVYTIFFSARRVAEGQPCPGAGPSEPSTYFATASGPDLNFGAPQPVHTFDLGPSTVFDPSCPKGDCRNAIRIDADVFYDNGSRWLFYTWFERGNNISSFNLDDPRKSGIVDNAGPARFPIGADEEGINEGPNVFRRGSFYYLFFSTGNFNSQYAMQYVMADSIEQLSRSKGVHRYSKAIRNSAGRFVESHGHNSIVERNGIFYNFFHQGIFTPDGAYSGRRNTYKQRLHFRDDGTISSLNLVDLKWTALPNTEYSLDVVTRTGEVIGNCINASRIGKNPLLTYTGICLSAGDRVIDKSDIASFRLFWSDNGQWGNQWKEIPYDGVSDQVFLDLKPRSPNQVDLSWTALPNTEYSLDVVTRTGEVIGNCVNASHIGKNSSLIFPGICQSAGNRAIPKRDIAAFRLFWSDNGQWGSQWKEIPYDGVADQVFLNLAQRLY